jgi:hypothetical protein
MLKEKDSKTSKEGIVKGRAKMSNAPILPAKQNVRLFEQDPGSLRLCIGAGEQ